MKLVSVPIFGLALAGLLAAQGVAPDCSLVAGWKQDGPSRMYRSENLFDYMDGNSEGYLLYQFVRMNGVNCRAGANTLVFDVSEMANPEMAYGMFMANRDNRQPMERIGAAGQVLARKVTFVKDKYYVEITASADTDNSTLLRAFANAMEKRVPGGTQLPEAASWFPKENLQPDSVRLIPESVLGISLLRRGYIGQYETGKAFIVKQDSAARATALMDRLRGRMADPQTVKLADEAFQATDRYLGCLCFFRKGAFIAGVANAKQPQDAVALAAIIAARIP